MFDQYLTSDWIDDDLKQLIEDEIVYNEDIDNIFYDEDWELFKMNDFFGGEKNVYSKE